MVKTIKPEIIIPQTLNYQIGTMGKLETEKRK
jgi:hypothetical protein